MNLDASLRASLVSRFADAVMQDAALPAARRQDVEEAPSFSACLSHRSLKRGAA
jgi:hypothetical protein